MKPFEHIDASTVEEALELLNKYRSKLIAGGTDLLGVLKNRILSSYPELLVNIKTIPGLDVIEETEDGLKIGALARLADITDSPLIKEKYPVLAEAAESVAVPQVRNIATIGGNLTQDSRCWYYRYPHEIGGRILCYLKGGKGCYALTGENRYHSIFGGLRNSDPPCISACPGSLAIPLYLNEIRKGDLLAAASILLDTNPLPAITGRICPHFCEQECNRGDFDESVSVRSIERFLGDYILDNKVNQTPQIATGQKVAVVGSGPAGLSAAYYLARAGHSVTIFEALPEAGGMLRISIPDYRLPRDVLDKQIKQIENTGIDIKLNTRIDSIDSLFQQGYQAVFLALGACRGTSLGIDGEDNPNVMEGLSFLSKVKLGEEVALGTRVAVIGGGEVAIDCARTALRLGGKAITMVYRRTRDEMPASAETIQEAIDEGVQFSFLSTPTAISRDENGQLTLTCIRNELGEPDASGRRQPVAVEGSEFSESYNSIIVAIGQIPDIPAQFGLKTGDNNTLLADSATLATDKPGVWAGGDVVTGSATVIEAIAAGKKAATAINLYLGEEFSEEEAGKAGISFLEYNSDYLKETSRIGMPSIPVTERSLTIEDNLGLGLSDIEIEANRCFNCSCVSVHPSDIGVALLALDASVTITGPAGARVVSIEEFYSSLGNILETDEMLTGIQVPRPPDRARQTFLKHRVRQAVDFAVVSLASIVTIKDGIYEDARIALGAVAPIPFRAVEAEQAISGKAVDSKAIEAAAEAAVTNAVPLTENVYKIEILKSLIKRALSS